jgi:cytidylate kinase
VAEVATLLDARDQQDRTRTASPLYAAPDAVIVDTTGRSVEQVVRDVVNVIASRTA